MFLRVAILERHTAAKFYFCYHVSFNLFFFVCLLSVFTLRLLAFVIGRRLKISQVKGRKNELAK